MMKPMLNIKCLDTLINDPNNYECLLHLFALIFNVTKSFKNDMDEIEATKKAKDAIIKLNDLSLGKCNETIVTNGVNVYGLSGKDVIKFAKQLFAYQLSKDQYGQNIK